MKEKIDIKTLEKYLLANKEVFKKYIPKNFGDDMVNYYCTDSEITSVTLYYLLENKYLALPKRNECKAASEWFYIYE